MNVPIDPKKIALLTDVVKEFQEPHATTGEGEIAAAINDLLAEREELLRENDRLRAGIGNHVPHGEHPADVHDFQCLACRILTWPFASSSRGGRSR